MAAPRVVVIGAGQAGSDTAAALRSRGFEGDITLVGDEGRLPYARPPLSKQFLLGTAGNDDLELLPPSFWTEQRVEVLTGPGAVRVDRDDQAVVLGSGRRLRWDKLVLATGARPRTLPVPGAGLDGVLTLRGVQDATRLRERFAGSTGPLRLVVVGAGFVGLEVAAAARKLGHHVTVIEAQPRALARAVTPEISDRLAEEHRRQGVEVLLRHEVTAFRGDDAGAVRMVELDSCEQIPADLVVVGIGVLPDVRLAADAGLLVGDGVIVDEHLRTSDRDIYAVGDCARFPTPFADRLVRLESVQNATAQARCVAASLCGDLTACTAVPWFWSEQYGMRLQIAGLSTGHDRSVLSGDPGTGRFSVLSFRRGRLIAVESVNRPADHGIARKLLTAGAGLSPEEASRPGFDLKTRASTPHSAPSTERPVHA
ncbi:NAD(P)/FAD-dependent oxidoreductase [Streptomyces sparsus]